MPDIVQVWNAYLLKPDSYAVVSRAGWAIPLLPELKAVFIDRETMQQEVVDICWVILDGERAPATFGGISIHEVIQAWQEMKSGSTNSSTK